MKILKILLIITLIMFAALFGWFWYIDFFAEVKVQEKETGSFILVGKEYVGSYKKSGKFMVEVEKKLKEAGVNSQKGFGVYYDNPKNTPEDECKSFVGDVLEGEEISEITKLQSLGFKVDSVAKKKSVVAYFPIKSTLSYMLGPLKIYPAFSKYLSDKGYKTSLSMEIYDLPNKQIVYIMQYE